MTIHHLSPPIPEDEGYRLSVLASLELLDSPPEPEFDALVQIAREVLHVPTALVSLVDAERQWFKARCGLDAAETPRDQAFCAYAVAERQLVMVPDATKDPRFAANPLVTGPQHIRFYAGVPLCVSPIEGGRPAVLGTLCVIDTKPRTPSDSELALLHELATIGERLIRARLHIGNAVCYAENRRADAERIRRQRDQLRRAEQIGDFGSWRLALADERLEWSENVFALHGLPVSDAPPLGGALDFYPPRARATVAAALARTIETGEPFDVEVDFHRADGQERRVRSLGEMHRDALGQPSELIGVFQDVTERHALEQALRRSASHDALTGLPNRAALNAELELRIAAAHHRKSPLALILLDLDGFKPVNDIYGHAAGDEVLQVVSGRLRSAYLDRCFAARLGGDEFVLLVHDADDCADLPHLAERLVETLARPIDIRAGSVTVGASLGVARLEPGMTASTLLAAADRALYDAKRDGKGCARGLRAAA